MPSKEECKRTSEKELQNIHLNKPFFISER